MSSYKTTLTVPESGQMNIPSAVCERHLVSEMPNERVVCQAIGRHLLVTVWSPNDNIQLWFPFSEWYTDKARFRSISRETLNLSRWQDKLDGRLHDDGIDVEVKISKIPDRWRHPDTTKTKN